jgi:hypothetical protein
MGRPTHLSSRPTHRRVRSDHTLSVHPDSTTCAARGEAEPRSGNGGALMPSDFTADCSASVLEADQFQE